MGYGIVLVLKKTFEDSASYEGRVAYAKRFKQMTKDPGGDMEDITYIEHFSEEYDEVQLEVEDDYDVDFYPNLIRVWTPLQWWTFFDYDSIPGSIRKLFQRLIDVIPNLRIVGSGQTMQLTKPAKLKSAMKSGLRISGKHMVRYGISISTAYLRI